MENIFSKVVFLVSVILIGTCSHVFGETESKCKVSLAPEMWFRSHRAFPKKHLNK